MTSTEKASVFQIAEMVADLLDQLKPEEKEQAMALLAKRYGLAIKDPPKPPAGRGYRPTSKRRY